MKGRKWKDGKKREKRGKKAKIEIKNKKDMNK